MYLSSLTILIPVFFGAVFYGALTRALKILYGFIVLSALFELWAAVLSHFYMSNLYLFHIQTLVEITLISCVYYFIFRYSWQRKIVVILSSLFIIYVSMSLYFDFSFDRINSTERMIESSILIIYFMLYVLHLLGKSRTPFLEMHPYFILTSGFLLYFSGTICVFIFSEELEGSTFLTVWGIHSLLNIFLNIIYTSVIWRSNHTLET